MAQEKKKIRIPGRLIVFLLIILVIVLFLWFVQSRQSSNVQTTNNMTMLQTVDISELSTAKFIYNGIASYKEEDKEICKILYHGEVKVGINVSKISCVPNEADKTIKPTFPEIRLDSSVIDTSSLSFIPANANINPRDALKVCEEDIQKKANADDKLWEIAKESVKKSITSLLYPMASANGYEIIWE